MVWPSKNILGDQNTCDYFYSVVNLKCAKPFPITGTNTNSSVFSEGDFLSNSEKFII